MNEDELIQATRNTPQQPKQRLIRDAALGVATAKCLIARMTKGDNISYMAHPYPCRICAIPTADIWPVYHEWMAWSMLEEPDGDAPVEVERFMRMSPEDQRRLVYEMQGYQEGPDGKPLPVEKKATGTEAPQGQAEPMGGRAGNRQRAGRRVGGAQEMEGTEGGGSSAREPETP